MIIPELWLGPDEDLHDRYPNLTQWLRKMHEQGCYIEYIQNLRVEAAKQQLETTLTPVDDISYQVGYEKPAFFRRLFKRSTGLTPSQYRRMFQPTAWRHVTT